MEMKFRKALRRADLQPQAEASGGRPRLARGNLASAVERLARCGHVELLWWMCGEGRR